MKKWTASIIKTHIFLIVGIIIFSGCSLNNNSELENKIKLETDSKIPSNEPIVPKTDAQKDAITTLESLINKNGTTIEERFTTPKGFERISVEEDSFAHYLRSLSLKPHDAKVSYYDGRTKPNRGIYEAVIDMEIGTRDLQQCADAIMRLRGEYLYHKEEYDGIHFNLTNGFEVGYTKWSQGYRVVVEGNNTSWVKKTDEDYTYGQFRKYMDFIFAYAGTLSLAQELESVSIDQMMIGDILIQGGSPGHGVIVVDMAEHGESGEKIYILAQSYMPAQDIQILRNPNEEALSPWYRLNGEEEIETPEWTFSKDDLKRF